ncbi:MAG: hypothetical protein AAF081_00945 [Actinomycetota bacterium]
MILSKPPSPPPGFAPAAPQTAEASEPRITSDHPKPDLSSTPAAGNASAGGLIAFLGWTPVAIGVVTAFATLVSLQDESEFLDLGFSDYLLAMSSGFRVTGMGLVAAATGSILSCSGSSATREASSL